MGGPPLPASDWSAFMHATLAPIAANIAQSLVTIPPGFQQVGSPADQ
jgi:hypothetical protein